MTMNYKNQKSIVAFFTVCIMKRRDKTVNLFVSRIIFFRFFAFQTLHFIPLNFVIYYQCLMTYLTFVVELFIVLFAWQEHLPVETALSNDVKVQGTTLKGCSSVNFPISLANVKRRMNSFI